MFSSNLALAVAWLLQAGPLGWDFAPMEARSKAFKDEPFHGSKVLMDWLVPDFLQEEVRVSHQLLGYASGVRMLSSPSSLLMRRNEQWRETLRIYPKGFLEAGEIYRQELLELSMKSWPTLLAKLKKK